MDEISSIRICLQNWKSTTGDSRLPTRKKEGIHQATSKQRLHKDYKYIGELQGLGGQLGGKYFDYFIFNIIDYIYVGCALPRSRARRRALAQTIGNARGLDINSPLSAEAHTQDLRFRRHQQHGDPNSSRGLDNNFTFDRGCDSTITTRLRHRRLRRADRGAPDKS
jgi:hypothetical protein